VAVQIYSDNSDEVTGATLNGGETGGTWTKAGELLGVTGGGLACSSPRCRPPHLKRQRQPEPDHAGGRLAFGFFLRGKLALRPKGA
jgi:hypothetical protein